MILAKRQLQRLRIKKELIYLPRIGIEYQKVFEDFNQNIKKNKEGIKKRVEAEPAENSTFAYS